MPTPPSTAAPRASSPSSAPQPTVSGPPIPCLGARVLGKVANADGLPVVSANPGVMKVGRLTMYNSTYDGVVDMPTPSGPFPTLKFSTDKAVNTPFP